jgi:L-fucose isomerase-like protein
MAVQVKLGLIPSYRFAWTPWTARMRQDNLTVLSRLPGVEVVVPQESPDGRSIEARRDLTPHGAVHTLDEAEAAAALFARERVDGLVICPLDFGDERSACKIAEKLRVPVLLYATKEPPAPADAGLSRVSDSYCGTLSIASGLHRRALPFHFAGIYFPDELGMSVAFDGFARAVAVVKGLRNARLGQIGVRPATFETVAYDEAALARKFGQNVIYADLDQVVADARQFADDDPRVTELVTAIRDSLREVTVADDHLLTSAKFELAVADFAGRAGLSALAVQCWPTIQRALGISLCAVFGRLTQRHLLTACEADVLGAVAMLAGYQAALGETLPHFVDWTIQHREDPNRLLAWHCGNAPLCLARDPEHTALRSRRDMTGELPVEEGDASAGLYQFQVKSGPVTFCRLAEYEGRWKMLLARGEVIPSEETLAGTWSWVQVRDHARLYRTLVEEGFIHHASMIHGDLTAPLRQACKFLDISPIVVE